MSKISHILRRIGANIPTENTPEPLRRLTSKQQLHTESPAPAPKKPYKTQDITCIKTMDDARYKFDYLAFLRMEPKNVERLKNAHTAFIFDTRVDDCTRTFSLIVSDKNGNEIERCTGSVSPCYPAQIFVHSICEYIRNWF